MIVIWISFLGRQGEGLQTDLPVPVHFGRERTFVFSFMLGLMPAL